MVLAFFRLLSEHSTRSAPSDKWVASFLRNISTAKRSNIKARGRGAHPGKRQRKHNKNPNGVQHGAMCNPVGVGWGFFVRRPGVRSATPGYVVVLLRSWERGNNRTCRLYCRVDLGRIPERLVREVFPFFIQNRAVQMGFGDRLSQAVMEKQYAVCALRSDKCLAPIDRHRSIVLGVYQRTSNTEILSITATPIFKDLRLLATSGSPSGYTICQKTTF